MFYTGILCFQRYIIFVNIVFSGNNIIYRETCLGNIHIIRTLSYKHIHLSYQKITQLDFDVKPKCEFKNVRFFDEYNC